MATGSSEFRTQLSTYLRAKAALLASVTAHRTLTGTGRELALIQYFEGLVPRRFEVLTGTVLAPAQSKFEAQVDLMFVNTHDYPVLVREGSLAVVVPQSVHTTIEVKTKLDKKSLVEALPQIRRANRCLITSDGERTSLSILFCYGTPAKIETLKNNLSDAWFDVVKIDADWRASDLADVIISSGASDACIAVRKPVAANATTYNLSAITPEDAISQLIHRVLQTLSPVQQDPIESGVATILSYFADEPLEVSEELTLDLPPPDGETS